ncbi:MAG: cardiolipin synthase B [Rubrivivax sp.]|nr:cardiolipin synthase B [Rubrivivax sp.]
MIAPLAGLLLLVLPVVLALASCAVPATRQGAPSDVAAAPTGTASPAAGAASASGPDPALARRAEAVAAALAASRPAAHAVAQQVSVSGREGALDTAARTRMLADAGGPGRAALLQRHVMAMAQFGDVDLHAHNEARLLVDGPATFDSMFEAIERARHSILLQSYIIEDSAIAQRLAALLVRRRAEGVSVAVLYDDVGSLGTSAAFFAALREQGVLTCAVNPVHPLKRPGYWEIQQRDHRKILSIDRQVGYTGGINISAVYSSGSFSRARPRKEDDARRSGWRDTQIRLRGPAVAALDDLVRATWREQGCRGELAPPPATAAGTPAGHLVRIVPSSPDDEFNRIYALLLAAIHGAERSVYLTMAYFAPGEDMVDALARAAQRGVDVQLVLPSMSDFTPVLHAGRSHYQRLLDAGVQLHELQDAVLHAKTAVIDGVVSTVGSSNLDWRSIVANREVNAVVLGEDFGEAMTRMFRRDVAASRRVTPEAWASRPWTQRLREALARAFEPLW